METIPKRPHIADFYRTILLSLERYLPLPRINPSFYESAGLVMSIVYLYTTNLYTKVLVLSLVLLSDWLDGATARRYKLLSKQGYLIDLSSDRISELIIFFPIDMSLLSWVFFTLAIANTILAYVSVLTGRHMSMALRFFYLLILIVSISWK